MKEQPEERRQPVVPKALEKLAPGLYVVGTPIGNLEDLSYRAFRVLSNVDWVGAEDTRETRKLLDHYGIHKETRALHEHSTKARLDELIASLKSGASAAYVSDAGTPGVCDPGAALVAACAAEGIGVYPVPGASAVASLLSIAGFEESAFRFSGFFPREKKDREAWAAAAGGLELFYESPHRIRAALEFLATHFPAAPLVVGRELTKRFETVTRGSAREVFEAIGVEEPRGEYALALLLPPKAEATGALAEGELRELVKELAALGAPQKALLRVGISHGLRKNEAYKLSLEALENQAGKS
jgi:16S rRNA (cytidine1402-2'-O)-methyltransferase